VFFKTEITQKNKSGYFQNFNGFYQLFQEQINDFTSKTEKSLIDNELY